MEQLIQVFPTWNKHDLRDVLDECNQDVDLAIDRISLGLVDTWHDQSAQSASQKSISTTEKRLQKDVPLPSSLKQHVRPQQKDVRPSSHKRDSVKPFRENTNHQQKKSTPSSTISSTTTPSTNTTETTIVSDENTTPAQSTLPSTGDNQRPTFASRVTGKSTTTVSQKSSTNNTNTVPTLPPKKQPQTTNTTAHSATTAPNPSSTAKSWAQLVKGKETVAIPTETTATTTATTTAAPAAEGSSKASAPAAKPVVEIVKKDRSGATTVTTSVIVTKTTSATVTTPSSATITNAAAQISAPSPKKSQPATPISPSKTVTAIAPPQPEEKSATTPTTAQANAVYKQQKPAARTLKQDAAVVMPAANNISSLGMRFGSLAIGSEQAQHAVNQQSVEATPAVSNLTSPLAQSAAQVPVAPIATPQIATPVHHQTYPHVQQQYAHQQQTIVPAVAPGLPVMPATAAVASVQPTAQQKLPTAPGAPMNPTAMNQSSTMMPPLGAMAMQQMHSGFGMGHMGAADYSALYNSDPQTRAMMGYYDPSMTYGHSIPQRYHQDAATAAGSVSAVPNTQGATNMTAAQQYAQQQQQQHGAAPGMQPSQPYPMPYPAYYPYYFAPNYGSNVYGNPYKNAAAPYGYPNPAASAAINMTPQQQQQQQQAGKGYYEDASGASSLGLDYKQYMQGQVNPGAGNTGPNAGPAGYSNKPQRRFDNTNGQVSSTAATNAQSQVPNGLSNAGAQQVGNPSAGQMGGMNQKGGNPAGGYYSYPQQRGSAGNTQYWTNN